MIVVGIVAILATVAIPEFGLMMVRAKTAERAIIMGRIKQGVSDLYLRNGSLPDGLSGTFNPTLPPTSLKRAPNWSQAGWNQILAGMGDIDGALYYSYYFQVWESVNPPLLLIWARGDVDGDGNPADKTIWYARVNGIYTVLLESPNPEDASVY
jgi:hypothetical protein